ncbi:hypothetical protein BCR34DRAFT_225886 [Clohesyomyces aquaticus]|uniref:Uncharacterized protein n=1 Tax=Clohesyomyces aquaticus TaxID=1231657 RepID=A0A1Y1Y8U1_9PLEO|nr:hypothetical protein BCR34DRAFT_225886 [Clohesyomyces aquaticus]
MAAASREMEDGDAGRTGMQSKGGRGRLSGDALSCRGKLARLVYSRLGHGGNEQSAFTDGQRQRLCRARNAIVRGQDAV